MSNLRITVLRGRDLAARDKTGKSDPYIVLKVDGKAEEKTKKIKQTLDPVWNEECILKGITDSSVITVQCYDWDAVGKDDSMGEFILPDDDVKHAKSATIEKWYELNQKKGEKEQVTGDILLRLEFPGITPLTGVPNQNFVASGAPIEAPRQFVEGSQQVQPPYPQVDSQGQQTYVQQTTVYSAPPHGEAYGVPPQGYAPQPISPYPPQPYAQPTKGQVVVQQTVVTTGPAVTVYDKPMKFRIKQKFFSSDMKIYNEAGDEILYAEQKTVSWGHDMKVYGIGGEQLGAIKQKFRVGMAHFKLSIRGEKVAVMKQKFSFKSPKFKIEMTDPKFGEDLVAKGDFLNYDFSIRRGDRLVATVSKKFFTFRDVYGVEIVPGEDVVLILQAVVVMDKCLHESDDETGIKLGFGFKLNF